MKELFSKIKDGIKNVLNNIKKTFSNIKNKFINIFLRRKNKEQKMINKTTDLPKNDGDLLNETQNVNSTLRDKNRTYSINYQTPRTSIRTNGEETIIMPVQRNINKKNESAEVLKDIKQQVPVITTINNISEEENSSNTGNQEKEHIQTIYNEEKIYSIDIDEESGIVEFQTVSGKIYQRNIQDIMDERKDIYAKFEINQKCRNLTRNRIQAIRLQRKLNPIVISALYDEGEINKYIECVNNIEGLWFNLKHNLINSKLNGKDARLMKRAGKIEEKIGGEVDRKKGLIEKILDKIRGKDKVDDISKELEHFEENKENSGEFENNIEENVQEKDKEEDMKRNDDYELNRRYQFYANLARRLFNSRPLKTLEEIRKSDTDRDLYELSSDDPLIKAIATLNVGKRLSKINTIEAIKYLNDAEKQFTNKNLLVSSENSIDYLEETLLSLRELYLKQKDYSSAEITNKKYMSALEKEVSERINPLILQAKENGNVLEELDYWMIYRRKLIDGQRGELNILSMTGRQFDAEELYRQMLDDSGIILSPKEYELSKKNNYIKDGKYVKIKEGNAITYSIIGDEGLLAKKQQIIEEKQRNSNEVETRTDTKQRKRVVTSSKVGKHKKVKAQGTDVKSFFKQIVNIIQNIGKGILQEQVEPDEEIETADEQLKTEPVKKVTEGQPEIALEGQIETETEKQAAEEKARIEEERKAAEKRARIEEERKAAEERARIETERKKAQIEEFNKRYSSYSVLTKGLIGGKAKRSIEEINKSIIHKDIYDMTSDDELVKGLATSRTGHRLATIPGKKKEAERLLKSAITILSKDEVLSSKDDVICNLEDTNLDLGELYVENGEFDKAEKVFLDYMNTVKREKIERYDPKIKKARAQGKVIDEMDCWMEYRAKLTTGRKAMIRLLSKSGDKKGAEELYKKLLEDCKISLTDEEYQLSV